MKEIYVTRSRMPSLEEYVEEIRPIFESARLTNMGPVHKNFENQLKAYLGVPELSLFVNGHLSLYLAIRALGLTGEVITTPFTFASTAHAIADNGLRPVFCDIDPVQYTIDVDKIEALITEHTSAIIPVHVYGNICDLEGIEKIAKKHNLKVIYDAAHAFGETVDGIGVGNFGDVSMFSFHATKVFHSIEGGALTYHDESLTETLYNLKNFGIRSTESVEAVGTNAKMNEFQAAMGLCNLRTIEAEIAGRRAVDKAYRQYLNGVPGLQLTTPQPGVTENYSYFPVVIEPELFGRDRDAVAKDLEQIGVFTRKYFYPLVSDYECYRDFHDSEQTPVAKKIAARVLTLPMYSELLPTEVEMICHCILGRD